MAQEGLRKGIGGLIARVPTALGDAAFELKVFSDVGLVRPVRPDKLARVAERYVRWGASPALGSAANALTVPDRTALIDEAGALTWAETHRRSNALARALRDQGIDEGDGVAIMCRNHRYFIEATMACSKLGALALYLNTAFSGPQLADVMEREGPGALIFDQEFTELLSEVSGGVRRYVAWEDEVDESDETTVEELISSAHGEDLQAPKEQGRYVILTSGTTGTPKGAQRSQPEGLSALATLFSKIPRRYGETVMIAAPLFHSWGFLHFMLSLPTAATMVLRAKFDPEETLKAVAEHRARVLAVVPVMMQRILALPDEVKRRYDLSPLEVTAASGSALPGELATRWMDEFGDNLYNLYGSTEVAWASIATPEDMRAAPGTAGRPPRGTVIRIVDEDGNDVETGETGRLFIGNQLSFEGYTGGGDKEHLGDLLSSGDVGHFDDDGRLFIDGRDDEMIVSGGENVFPREVEDLLADHEAVAEAAAIGVEDEDFGQRLVAFVVKADGKDASEEDLKGYVKQNLAGYKVPREIVFLDELPRNATGKVLKRELAERQHAD
ncbi:MAG TPA: AMP-binding protein [Solirubrobacterales bacterium]|nr:AMP-binding protein [Solirubrobacterales bacterium]